MFMALLRKQLLELASGFTRGRKTGGKRGPRGVILYVLLYILIFVGLASSFFGISMMLGEVLIPAGLSWLYFVLAGILTLGLGAFGDMFTANAALFQPKDNELLLSLPIPPRTILLVRMLSIYLMGLQFCSIVFLPAILVYWLKAGLTLAGVLCPIVTLLLISLLVLCLSCLLGWLVALIAARIKSKNFFTVLFSLVFFALYYYFFFRVEELLDRLVQNVLVIGERIETYVYPLYAMGMGASGDLPRLLVFAAIVIAVFALTLIVISRSFSYIVTMKRSGARTEYKAEPVKSQSPSAALLRKELRRFLSSPTYMLNCGLGLAIFPFLGVIALVRQQDILATLEMIAVNAPAISSLVPLLPVAAAMFILATNSISAPSVSLEGKNIWIVQSLPVAPCDVLTAKRRLHDLLNVPAGLLGYVLLGLAFKLQPAEIILGIVPLVLFVRFHGAFGLVLNLLRPDLNWTHEVVPVKQSMSVGLALFGGWIIATVVMAICALLMFYASVNFYLCVLVASLLLALGYFLLDQWLRTRGADIFAAL